MRLIDADALQPKARHITGTNLPLDGLAVVYCKDIRNAPTVDAQAEVIKKFARIDECCPPVECPGEGASCVKCWTQFIEEES